MFGIDLPLPLLIVFIGVPLIFAVVLHEIAHGWVAKLNGDPTAYELGRLSLNPIRHVDPVGTLLVPLLLVLFKAPFVLGWAKPVPIDWRRLHNPRRDMVWVAAAGPLANLLMAFLWASVAKMLTLLPTLFGGATELVYYMCLFGTFINLLLMIFNLLPLPPLDGGRVAVGLLPDALARPLARVEPYGLFIVIGLAVSGLLAPILQPGLHLAINLIGFVTGH